MQSDARWETEKEGEYMATQTGAKDIQSKTVLSYTSRIVIGVIHGHATRAES